MGGFFLEIIGSWAFVPEGRFPIVIVEARLTSAEFDGDLWCVALALPRIFRRRINLVGSGHPTALWLRLSR